jgi:hypothetical protein
LQPFCTNNIGEVNEIDWWIAVIKPLPVVVFPGQGFLANFMFNGAAPNTIPFTGCKRDIMNNIASASK